MFPLCFDSAKPKVLADLYYLLLLYDISFKVNNPTHFQLFP